MALIYKSENKIKSLMTNLKRNLEKIALIYNRYSISDRAAAAIASSVLLDA